MKLRQQRQHPDRAHRHRPKRAAVIRLAALLVALAVVATACGSDETVAAEAAATEVPAAATAAPTAEAAPTEETEPAPVETGQTMEVRESGMTVTVQPLGDVTVHSVTAPVQMFANSTHIIETANSLVLVDTQFFLPNALDFRAYADELGKPIDRLLITHDDPDHFLGSEAFADIDVVALPAVSESIAEIGDAEVADQQANFGDAIAGSFVTPETIETGTFEIDGVVFEVEEVFDAEAEVQMVMKVPSAGVIVAGDIVYSGVHLILAGQPDTWTVALNELKATSEAYPIVLPGHGLPTTPDAYDVNIDWLATASELIATVSTGDEFKSGLTDAFPDLGLEGAIDFAIPSLFPEPDSTDAESD